MIDAKHAFTDAGPEAFSTAGADGSRIPRTQAAAFIVSASLGLWCAIGLGVNWLVW